MLSMIRNPSDNTQEVVYTYAVGHPGLVYFPWNGLSTLLAEGKLYHFEWGIYDRYEAKTSAHCTTSGRTSSGSRAGNCVRTLPRRVFMRCVFSRARRNALS